MNINMTYLEKMRSINNRRLCIALLLLLLLLVIGQMGCTRSMIQDGTKVAQMGTATAKQMAAYYETLQKDTIDTYELNAFREAYLLEKAYGRDVEKAKKEGKQLPATPNVGLSEIDKQILKEYQKTYQALEARIQLSHSMQDAYDSYAHLNDYNAAEEVDKAISNLSKTVGAASNLVLPDPTGTVTSVVQGLFKDIINELAMVQENRAILSGSERLASVLDKLKQVFDSEKILLWRRPNGERQLWKRYECQWDCGQKSCRLQKRGGAVGRK